MPFLVLWEFIDFIFMKLLLAENLWFWTKNLVHYPKYHQNLWVKNLIN